MAFENGHVLLVQYVGETGVWYQRMVARHASEDEYVAVIPDYEMSADVYAYGGVDPEIVRLRSVVGASPLSPFFVGFGNSCNPGGVPIFITVTFGPPSCAFKRRLGMTPVNTLQCELSHLIGCFGCPAIPTGEVIRISERGLEFAVLGRFASFIIELSCLAKMTQGIVPSGLSANP